jgi:hypothetical protein
VTSESFTGNKEGCKEGGSKFTVGGKTTIACNGEKGAKGTNGTNGAIHGEEPLPSGATETGVWSFDGITKEAGLISVPVASFAVQLSAALEEGAAHFINASGEEVFGSVEGETRVSTVCTGTVENPKAQPGNLCVYAAEAVHALLFNGSIVSPSGGASAGKAGALMQVNLQGFNPHANGAWAVTGP